MVVVGRGEDGGEGGDGGGDVVDYCQMVSRFVLFCFVLLSIALCFDAPC